MAENDYQKTIIELLIKQYPNPVTELQNWTTPMQFMVSVILSAQATDKGVNKISGALFDKYKSAKDFGEADLNELKTYIKSINFYNNKALRIIEAGQYITNNYKGEIPDNMDDLIKIPGVGRKSANVILNEVFNKTAGVVVDTHIIRLSNRLNLTKNTDAVKIEQDLMSAFDKSHWKHYAAAGVLHGRYVCKARKPLCSECILNQICPSAFKV